MNGAGVESDVAGRAAGRWGRPEQPDARRSLWLCGAGALIGLALSAFGLFTAQGTRSFVVPPEDAALVNGVPILMADLIGQLRALYDVSLSAATPLQKQRVLNDMIREELLVQRGLELGLPRDDIEVRQALVAATGAAVSQDAMTARPSGAELHAWYTAHAATYAAEGQMTVQDFLLPAAVDSADAGKRVSALRAGASPESLALESSGRVNDGAEFYFAAKLHLQDALFEAARKMHAGEVSDPIPQADGVHILIMQHNQPPLPVRYEDAEDRVLRDYLADKVAHLQASNERFLSKRADIRIAPGLR